MNNRQRQRASGHGPKFTNLELWNLDAVLARVIAAGLRQFIAMPRHTYATETPEKWEATLRELLWTFTEIADDFPGDPYNAWFNAEYAKLEADPDWQMFMTTPAEDGCYHVTKWNFPDCPQTVLAAQKAYYDRVKAGVNLFAEHLFDLWD